MPIPQSRKRNLPLVRGWRRRSEIPRLARNGILPAGGHKSGPYLGKANLSSRPISKAGFFRFRTKAIFSESAVTSIGKAMVESQ